MKKFRGSSDYVASNELMNAVNVAIALEKPLLIKGEPGTGKTMLAQSIADHFGSAGCAPHRRDRQGGSGVP